jgi:hypothetical protein
VIRLKLASDAARTSRSGQRFTPASTQAARASCHVGRIIPAPLRYGSDDPVDENQRDSAFGPVSVVMIARAAGHARGEAAARYRLRFCGGSLCPITPVENGNTV